MTTASTTSADQSRALLENMATPFYICDAKGYITYYNSAAAKLWGREPELNKDMWYSSFLIKRLDGTPMPFDECPMAITLKEGRPVRGIEIVIERADGTNYNILPHPDPVFNDKGEITGATNILIDVTDYKRVIANRENEELRRSEEKYHLMVEEVQDYAILMLNKSGIIENWNKGAEKIKGYKANEAIGRSFHIFYTPEDLKNDVPESLLATAASAGRANHEGWRVRKDGSKFWGSVIITTLRDSTGEIIGFTKVTRDLTGKKFLEDSLKASAAELEQKNEALEKVNQELTAFVYVSSHDLQEPLRKIQTFVSYILEFESHGFSEKAKDYFNRIQNTAFRMQQLIKDLLSYAKINTGEKHFVKTNLNVLLDEVKSDLREIIEEKGLALVVLHSLPEIEIIPFQFRQLFTNVISNSLKFSKDGVQPEIMIDWRIVNGKLLNHPLVRPQTDYYHLSISDNGIGFPEESTTKVFEIFQRLHNNAIYKGTGIGLAICKKIVENHAGFITAEGAADQGATIHVYLPYKK